MSEEMKFFIYLLEYYSGYKKQKNWNCVEGMGFTWNNTDYL